MRQAWINDLRDTVSEFVSAIYVAQIQLTGAVDRETAIRHSIEVDKRDRQESLFRLKEKIWLLINPHEAEHQELGRLVESAFAAHLGNHDTHTAIMDLRTHAQAVLKAEWNVVKK